MKTFQIQYFSNLDASNDGFITIKAKSIQDAENIFIEKYPNFFLLDIFSHCNKTKKMNYITVAYYMKGEQKQYRSFGTITAAQAFMTALAENEECESYGIESRP